MKRTGIDQRTQRTSEAIRRAFDKLVLTKEYSEISITELSSLAGINRKTFYLHYKSLNDLMCKVEKETAATILSHLQDAADNYDVASCIRSFYEYMENCTEVQRRLLTSDSYQFFYVNVANAILSSDVFQRFYEPAVHPQIVRAYCTAITAIYRSWVSAGRPIPLSELIQYASDILLNGYNAVLKNAAARQ